MLCPISSSTTNLVCSHCVSKPPEGAREMTWNLTRITIRGKKKQVTLDQTAPLSSGKLNLHNLEIVDCLVHISRKEFKTRQDSFSLGSHKVLNSTQHCTVNGQFYLSWDLIGEMLVSRKISITPFFSLEPFCVLTRWVPVKPTALIHAVFNGLPQLCALIVLRSGFLNCSPDSIWHHI